MTQLIEHNLNEHSFKDKIASEKDTSSQAIAEDLNHKELLQTAKPFNIAKQLVVEDIKEDTQSNIPRTIELENIGPYPFYPDLSLESVRNYITEGVKGLLGETFSSFLFD